MPAEPVQRAVRPFVSGGGASVGARLSAAASMVVGLVVGLVLAVVCALLMVALSIVTGLGRAAQDGVERLRSNRRRAAMGTPADRRSLPGPSARPSLALGDVQRAAAVAARHPACQVGARSSPH
ncbi:hypothetical protein GCM10010210_35940 [Pseudonocardia hydrocarbonoxydans]